MKKVIDFTFNKELYRKLAKALREAVVDTPFKGHVFLCGDAIINQILGRNVKSEYLNVVVDIQNGGITFPVWLTYKQNCYCESENPLIDAKNSSSIFHFANDSELGSNYFLCQQTRNSFFHTEERSSDKWFGTIEQDAEKRGFTFESLYYNVSDECLYDLTEKAFDDIENKIIRATNTKTIFLENPAKILSAIRAANDYGFGIEKNTWFAMVEHARNIKTVRTLTLRTELDKIITSNKPSESIKRMINCGLIGYTWPFLMDMANLKTMPYDYINETVLDHTLKVIDAVPPSLITRLGALLHDIGKIRTANNHYIFHQLEGSSEAKKILESMNYSSLTIEGVRKIVECHEDLSKFKGNTAPGSKFAKKFARKCGKYLNEVLDVIDANNKAQIFGKKAKQVLNLRGVYCQIEKDKNKNEQKKIKLPINGNDIKKEFKLKTGVTIGRLIDIVKNEYQKNPRLTKDECFTICENALSKGI